MALPKDTVTQDYLKEDPMLPGQLWACVSFVNPKDIAVDKQLYYVNKFLVDNVNKSIVAQGVQMAKKLQSEMRKKISDKLDRLKLSTDPEDKHMFRILNAHFNEMHIDEEEFVEECNRQYTIDSEELLDRFKIYLAENRAQLDNVYDTANDNANSVRGFKVRGTFATHQEACRRCEKVRDTVEPSIHAYVVPVGQWFPVDMDADEVQDQDYMLPALNNLMGKYHEGMRNKDKFFQERKRELMETPDDPRSAQIRKRLQKKLEAKKKAQMKEEVEAFQAQEKITELPEETTE